MIGVDNEEVICVHVQPQLTSVIRDNQQEGYRAAALLDQLIRGRKVETLEEMIPPLGVVARESTETVAFRDPRLCEAIEYLNKHIDDPIGVQELASHVGVSRRWMEYAFRDALKESPYQYIRHRRLKAGAAAFGKRVVGQNLPGRGAHRILIGKAVVDVVLPGVRTKPARIPALDAISDIRRRKQRIDVTRPKARLRCRSRRIRFDAAGRRYRDFAGLLQELR